jgi:hypothetical protein
MKKRKWVDREILGGIDLILLGICLVFEDKCRTNIKTRRYGRQQSCRTKTGEKYK